METPKSYKAPTSADGEPEKSLNCMETYGGTVTRILGKFITHSAVLGEEVNGKYEQVVHRDHQGICIQVIKLGGFVHLNNGIHNLPCGENYRVSLITELGIEISDNNGKKAFIPHNSIHHFLPAIGPREEVLCQSPQVTGYKNSDKNFFSSLEYVDMNAEKTSTVHISDQIHLIGGDNRLPLDGIYTITKITPNSSGELEVHIADNFNSAQIPLSNIYDLSSKPFSGDRMKRAHGIRQMRNR